MLPIRHLVPIVMYTHRTGTRWRLVNDNPTSQVPQYHEEHLPYGDHEYSLVAVVYDYKPEHKES